MLERKYHYQWNAGEYTLILSILIELNNILIKQGRNTDAVDDLLIRLSSSKKGVYLKNSLCIIVLENT